MRVYARGGDRMADTRAVAVKIRQLLLEIEEGREIDADEVRRLKRIKIPPWVHTTAQGVLAGYDERERALRREDGAPVVLQEYRRINRAIDNAVLAATEDCSQRVTDMLLRDMIERQGYYGSLLADMMSEYKYYEYKRTATVYVAAKLYLI